MIQIDTPMPECCDECFACDVNKSYPFCTITFAGYPGMKFNTRLGRMPVCPLQQLPSAVWILSSIQDEEDSSNGNYLYECSNCGAGDVHSEKVYVPYCWHCGASMKRDSESIIDS